MTVFDTIYKISLIGTFIVLVWYAYETRAIRLINKQQKDLQLMPAMMIYIRQHSGSERPYIRNIGSGTSVAVELPTTAFMVEGRRFEFSFNLADGNNTLVPQEERLIGVNLMIDGQSHGSPLPNFLAYYSPVSLQDVHNFQDAKVISSSLPTNRILEVVFRDITGQKYKTLINFSKDGLSVARAPERVK